MITTEEQVDRTTMSMAEVALNFPQALGVLQKYNLDYCCGGKKPFNEVCKKAGVDSTSVWKEIIAVANNHGSDNRMNFNTWEVSLIIDFILQHHHSYVRSAIPQIQELLEKVCSVHGNDTPDLFTIRKDFNDLAEELMDHMPKEENVLFPAMKRLFVTKSSTDDSDEERLRLRMPVKMMEHEHEEAGKLIKSIRDLTSNYTPPNYACPTFKMTYLMLQQFDTDLLQHIHIENNILFPKVKEEVHS